MRTDNYQRDIRIVIVSGPASEPVTVSEFKDHQRIDHSTDDALIALYIKAARELVEAYTGRRMMPRTEKLYLDDFPPADGIVIAAAPVRAVTKVAVCDDSSPAVETEFAASNYVFDTSGPLARVLLKSGSVWPTIPTDARPRGSAQVTFSSGYASSSDIPEGMKLGLKLLAAHIYENREATTPLTVNEIPLGLKYVLQPYVVWETR